MLSLWMRIGIQLWSPVAKLLLIKGGAKYEKEINSPLHNLNSFINAELLFKSNVMGSATAFENGERKLLKEAFMILVM